MARCEPHYPGALSASRFAKYPGLPETKIEISALDVDAPPGPPPPNGRVFKPKMPASSGFTTTTDHTGVTRARKCQPPRALHESQAIAPNSRRPAIVPKSSEPAVDASRITGAPGFAAGIHGPRAEKKNDCHIPGRAPASALSHRRERPSKCGAAGLRQGANPPGNRPRGDNAHATTHAAIEAPRLPGVETIVSSQRVGRRRSRSTAAPVPVKEPRENVKTPTTFHCASDQGSTPRRFSRAWSPRQSIQPGFPVPECELRKSDAEMSSAPKTRILDDSLQRKAADPRWREAEW